MRKSIAQSPINCDSCHGAIETGQFFYTDTMETEIICQECLYEDEEEPDQDKLL